MLTINKKFIFIFSFLSVFTVSVYAYADLSAEQATRAEKIKTLLGDTDTHPLSETIKEIKKSSYPEGELQIRETVAKTFSDMVKKYQPTDKEARVRLLDKVRMNMAYFQLGGPDTERPQDSSLDIVIRRKLKEYLSPQLRADKRFFYSIEQ